VSAKAEAVFHVDMIEALLEASNRFEYALGSDTEIQDAINSAIDDVLELLEASPLVGLFQIRRKSVGRFDYHLIYEVRTDKILFLALAHKRRAPFYWRTRHES
jgi:ParE toxin of type II toxin-antitoxin system, parDE